MLRKNSKYIMARERLEQVKKFYRNLTSYIFVIGFLALLNYVDDQWGEMWFLWVAFGWGIGIFFHALKVFGLNLFFSRDWEGRMIKRFMQQEEELMRNI